MVIKLWWWWCFSKRVPFQEPQTRAKVCINVWMSCVEHWAEAFRDAWVFLKFVREIGSGSLPPLVPSYQHNLDTNFKLSSRNWKFNDNGPSYFRNRSPYFIKKKIHEQQVPYWWVSQKWYWLCGQRRKDVGSEARVMWRLSTSPSISNAHYSHRKRYSNMQKSSNEALESINHELLQSILYENNLPSKKKKKTKRVACCRRSVRKTERNCRRWESSGEVKKWGRLGRVGSGEEHYATRPKLPSFFHSFATITPFTIALRFNN